MLNIEKIAEDFQQLAILKDGWLDGEGKALDKKQLVLFYELLVTELSVNIPNPHIYPTIDSGITLEWDIRTSDIDGCFEVEINLDTFKGWATGYEIKTKTPFELDLELGNKKDWNKLRTILDKLFNNRIFPSIPSWIQ